MLQVMPIDYQWASVVHWQSSEVDPWRLLKVDWRMLWRQQGQMAVVVRLSSQRELLF
jgi:hypothetical protein